MEENTITLARFLSRYLGIQGCSLKKLSHEDVKHLFPNLVRASFESYEKSLVNKHKTGNKEEIVLVYDGKKTIPYYTPRFDINDVVEVEDCESKSKERNSTPDYSNMKVYELKKLLNYRFNGREVSRKARRELWDRGVVLGKKYNRQEFKKWESEYERDKE